MRTVKVSYNTKEESKAGSLKLALEMDPVDRLRIYLQMSELCHTLYPPRKTEPDQNFHIYPHERK